MRQFILIQPSEDDNPISWLKRDQIHDIGQVIDDYGIERFLDAVPNEDGADPNYWQDGSALLLEVRVIKVRPKEVVTAWEVEL